MGLVSGQLPKIHAAQPSGSAPVVRALDAGLEFPEPVKPDTIAKSLAIGNPADGFQVVRVVKETGGAGAMVAGMLEFNMGTWLTLTKLDEIKDLRGESANGVG